MDGDISTRSMPLVEREDRACDVPSRACAADAMEGARRRCRRQRGARAPAFVEVEVEVETRGAGAFPPTMLRAIAGFAAPARDSEESIVGRVPLLWVEGRASERARE